jgi:hypothetical protein
MHFLITASFDHGHAAGVGVLPPPHILGYVSGQQDHGEHLQKTQQIAQQLGGNTAQ